MGNCRDTNLKYNCGDKRQNARCVLYEGYIPNYSKLLDEDCISLEETTEELYQNQEKILNSIDLTKLGKECIDYSEFQEDDSLKVNEALLTIEKEICNLKKITDDNDDSSLELDFKCLVDPCNNEINSLRDLLQVLINEVCNLKDRIKILES